MYAFYFVLFDFILRLILFLRAQSFKQHIFTVSWLCRSKVQSGLNSFSGQILT